MQVQATVTDAHPNDHAQITYEYWPVDHPDQRKRSGPSLDLSGFADGTVVAWTARGDDYDDAGPWGKTCYFTVDKTAPTTRPVVSSKMYPSTDYPGTAVRAYQARLSSTRPATPTSSGSTGMRRTAAWAGT
jgi:hypothetical protein